MKKILLVCALVVPLALTTCSTVAAADGKPKDRPSKQSESLSFIALGDVHYCDETYYDLSAMLAEKPGDHHQITATYAPVTKANWTDQIAALKARIDRTQPPVKCVVQLGDISEGLANSTGYADRMADNMMQVLRDTKIGVPWVLTKGNHDITGVGDYRTEAQEAFRKYYTPFIKEQTGSEAVDGNYTYQIGEVLFVVLDAYNRQIDQTAFAKEALENSTAKYKFVCMHEPAIPATERCWHYLKSKPEAERSEFLKVIAQNKAFFLCGHLHRYSVLRRDTEWGPIVQVMAASVTNIRRTSKPKYELTTADYGESLVDRQANWNPSTAEQRKATLREEAKHVSFYKMTELAGYAVISVDPQKDQVMLRYYTAFDTEPYDEISLTELYNRN